MPGPLPKRIEERRRKNVVPGETVATMLGDVKVPDPDPGWHPVAREWYEAVRDSGQALFFEPSDWAAARYICAAMTKNLNQEARFSAQLFGTVWSAMNDMLTSEAARRKAKLQVQRVLDDQPEEEKPTAMAKYRQAFGG